MCPGIQYMMKAAFSNRRKKIHGIETIGQQLEKKTFGFIPVTKHQNTL